MRFAQALTLILFFLTTNILISCAPSTVNQLTKDKGAKKLTADEIILMAKGNTLFVRGHDRANIYLYFDESGHVFGLDIYNNKDTGRWDVSNQGEVCFKLKEWWSGDLRCFPVYYDSSKYYLVNNSGVLVFTADHLQGDSKNLYHDLSKTERSFLMSKSNEVSVNNPSTQSKPADAQTAPEIINQGEPTEEELKSTVKWMAKDCPDCNLAGTNLEAADLIGAKLQGANLSGANLRKANLRRAELREANLENADLSYANLPGADLRGSNLTNAVLKGANLIRANFTGAEMSGADFEGALLEGAEGLNK